MLQKLKQQMQGVYPADCVDELERMEEYLHFDHFDSQTALCWGNLIVKESEKYKEELAVRIIRLEDSLPIYQYIGTDKSQRNIDYAMMKANTVLKTGHCSLWALVKEQAEGGVVSVFCENSGCLPVGGAFPVFSNGRMTAVAAVSGLHNGMDHQVVIDALCRMKNIEIPAFKGRLI